jgi:hypothetical protein
VVLFASARDVQLLSFLNDIVVLLLSFQKKGSRGSTLFGTAAAPASTTTTANAGGEGGHDHKSTV